LIGKKTIVVLILSIFFTSTIIALDFQNYEEFNIERHFNGTYKDGEFYIVYQDYRNLYASIGLLIWNQSTGQTSTVIIETDNWDSFNPKIYHYNNELIISWLELQDSVDKFAYRIYNTTTGKSSSKVTVDIEINQLLTDSSFDGSNFTIATPNFSPDFEGKVDYWRVPVQNGEVTKSTINFEGLSQRCSVQGADIYLGYRGNSTSTKISLISEDNLTVLANTTGYIRDIKGYNGHAAWLHTEPGNPQRGKVSYSNGYKTVSLTLTDVPESLDLVEIDGTGYIAYTETLTMESDKTESALEVQIGVVINITDPELSRLDTASDIDGSYSRIPIFVRSDEGLFLFWHEGVGHYSLRTSGVNEDRVSDSTLIIENGDWGAGISVALVMILGMGGLFGFMIVLGRENSKKAKKLEEEKRESGVEAKENADGKKSGSKFSIEFHHYNKLEPYFYLKFFFVIAPFLFVAGSFLDITNDRMGVDIGFRIGYSYIINLAFALVVSSFSLFIFRGEANASFNHRVGYGIIQLSFFLALLGLLWYMFSKDNFNQSAIYVVYFSYAISTILAIIGPAIMLYALSLNRAFLVPLISYGAIIIIVIRDIILYSSYQFFPSVFSPSSLIGSESGFMFLLVHMMIGMVLAMTLFDIMKYERIKQLNEWTKKDIYDVRNRAVTLSLLITLFFVLTTFFLIWDRPLFDLGLLAENAMMSMLMLIVSFMIFGMIKSMLSFESFYESFKESPSGAIYKIYLTPVMISIMILIFGMFIGVFAFVVVCIYAYVMYKSNLMLKYLGKDALKDAVEEDEAVQDQDDDEEETKVQITRADVAVVVKRNLRQSLAIPPIAAMVLLTAWKLELRLPQFQWIIPDSIWTDIVVMSIAIISLLWIIKTKRSFEKAEELSDLIGFSSTSGNDIMVIMLMIFYILGGGNFLPILITILTLQIHAGLHYILIFTPMLKKLNDASKSFYFVPLSFAVEIIKVSVEDENKYMIPGEAGIKKGMEFREGEEDPDRKKIMAKITKTEKKEDEVAEGKGKMFSREPFDSIQFRRNVEKQKAMNTKVIGLIIIFGGTLLTGASTIYPLILSAALIILTLGIIVILFGFFRRKSALELDAITVYENGLDIPQPSGESIFFPFEGFLACEIKYIMGKKAITFQGSQLVYTFKIWKGLENFVEGVNKKVGRDPTRMPSTTGHGIKNIERYLKFIVPISIALASGVTLLIAFIMSSFVTPIILIMIGMPVITVTVMSILSSRLVFAAKASKKPFRLPRIQIYAVAIACILLALMTTAIFSQTNMFAASADYYKSDIDDLAPVTWFESDMTDQTIYMDHWLVIDGEVSIKNCSLTFNCTTTGEYGLIITEGSKVSILGSEITGPSPMNGFIFEIKGETEIRDTVISNVYGCVSQENYQGGLEIYADSILSNVTVQGSLTNGILIGGCDVTIIDSIISDTDDEGIEIFEGSLLLQNSTLDNCAWGIHLIKDAEIVIENSEFINCANALTLSDNSNAALFNSTIRDSSITAIMIYPNCQVTLNNVELNNNNRDWDKKTYFMRTTFSLLFPLIITVVNGASAIMTARKSGQEKIDTDDESKEKK
jgi:hypothetical protein